MYAKFTLRLQNAFEIQPCHNETGLFSCTNHCESDFYMKID